MTALALALLAAPATSDASFLSRGSGSDIFYVAEAGEDNALTVEVFSAPPDFHVFFDPAATINASSGCFNLTPNLAACQAFEGDSITAVLADGDDSVLSTSPFMLFGCGGEGDDTLTGGPGEDFLLGEGGFDTIDGGEGNDIVITNTSVCEAAPAAPAGNDVQGGPGDDALIGGKGADTMRGGAGVDTLFGERVDDGAGGDAADDLSGGGGDDQLVGHDGNDLLDGGDGADMLAGGGGDDQLLGDQGDDQLGVTVNQSFRDQNDDLQRVLTSETGADGLDGGPGDDVLNGGPGAQVLNFGLEGSIDASETTAANGPDDLVGGEGRDTVTYVNLALPVEVSPDGAANDGSAGEGDNVHPDNEVLVGGSLGDTLIGSDGGDTIDGGGGGDRIDGAGGDDTLRGGEDGGGDAIFGGPGSDSLGGGPGDDSLEGQDGADTVEGGGGGDSAGGGADADRVSGGAGLDSLSGGPGDDRLRGGADGLVGADGADVLRGDDGNDDLDGGAGDDTLAGGAGGDALAGSDGRDLADYGAAGGPVTVELDGAPGDGEAGEGDHVHADVEGARGGFDRDTLIGDGGANRIEGGAGDDFIDGRGGDDRLAGDAGADFLRARDRFADLVDCGAGLDFTVVNRLDRVGDDCERVDEGRRRRPEHGRSMVVRPTGGSAELRLAGTGRFVPLLDPLTVPLRSSLDATDGAVRVTTEGGEGRLDSGVFSDGRFRVVQPSLGGAATRLRLEGGAFGDCSSDGETVRSLRGRGRGRFRTRGRDSLTSTRGASWVVRDRCDGTLTRVRRGEAVVFDLERRRRVPLRAGQSYLAGAG